MLTSTAFPRGVVLVGAGLSVVLTIGLVVMPIGMLFGAVVAPGKSVPPSDRVVAVVEDSSTYAKLTPEIVATAAVKLAGTTSVQVYPLCEALLADMSKGKRFALYIVDYQLDDHGKVLWGLECTEQIHLLHSSADIVGFSTLDFDPGFVRAGAQAYVSKTASLKKIVGVLQQFLH